jgi:predicted aconitase with swiveling domain
MQLETPGKNDGKERSQKICKCRSIVKGTGKVSGEVLVSRGAMCFYLCDPQTGTVIERNHPLNGRSVAGKILLLESGKGSSVVQVDGFYQLWRKGTLPKAIILRVAEPVIVSAAVIADVTMVDRVSGVGENTPQDIYGLLHDGDFVEIDAEAEEIRIGESARVEC